MALITSEILPQQFEVIRDRIADILIAEIQAQLDLNSTLSELVDGHVEIGIERSIPINYSETTIINVSYGSGEYGNQDTKQSEGSHIYFIDVFATGCETTGIRGDVSSARKTQRILGICRAILESSHYMTLGFTAPSISRRYVGRIDISEIQNNDSVAASMGRMTFYVRVPEGNIINETRIMNGYITQIKIAETDKGFVTLSN